MHSIGTPISTLMWDSCSNVLGFVCVAMCAVCMYICVCTVGTHSCRLLKQTTASYVRWLSTLLNRLWTAIPLRYVHTKVCRTYVHVSLHDTFVNHASMLMDQSPLSLLSRWWANLITFVFLFKQEEAQAGLDKLCALLPTIGAEVRLHATRHTQYCSWLV